MLFRSLLRLLSMQYSYDVAPTEAPQVSTSAVLDWLEALLAGVSLLNAAGIAALMVMLNGLSAVREAASVTRMVNENGPAVSGVPAIFPVLGVSVRPLGSEPLLIDHVYAVVPPVA